MLDTKRRPPGLRLIQLERRHTRPDLDPVEERAAHWAWRYVAAVGFVAFAASVNAAAPDFLGRTTPFFVYFPAIVLAGFIGGFGPGMAATLLSALMARLNLAPFGSFAVANRADEWRVFLFVALGTLMSYVKHVLHSAVRRARTSEKALARETALTALSEAKYRSLFESMDEGFCIVEMVFDEAGKAVDYVFLEANPAFERQTGLKGALGRRMSELAPGHERHWYEIYGRIAETGQAARFERRAAALGRWYDVYAWRFGEARSRRVAVLFNDVSVRHAAEEALADEVRRRELIMDAMPGLVAYIAPSRRYVYANRAYRDWLGVAAAGRRVQDVLGAAYGVVGPRLDEALAGRRVSYAARAPYPTGERWIQAEYVPDVAPDGRVRGVVSLVLDVGERMAAGEALRRGERQLRTIIDEMPFLISYIGRDRRYVFNNRRYAEWLQRSPQELRGASVEEVVGPERWKAIEPKLSRAMGGETTVFESFVAYADRPRWIRAEFVPDRDKADGLVRGVFAFVADVTDARRQEAELKEAVERRTRELARSNAELEAFSYTVSHDLRAPLRAIQGYAHFVAERLKGRADRETIELLGRIGSSTTRMDRMIQDLLALGRISRGEADMSPVDVEPVVDHVLSHYQGFEKARIVVRRPLGRVIGQDSMLTQALSNLLVNAVKFVAKGRTPAVEIRAEPAGGRVRLVVQDNGIGVPPELSGKLFRPFSRLHPRGEYEGTGIGLAIVKKSAERMGGAAGVEPAPGGGSMFWIELRRAP